MRQWLFASLIKFVSLTSQSITKCYHRRRKEGLCIYFGGNIFNIKLTIVAAQKLLYCQFSALYTQFRLTPAKKAFNDLKGFLRTLLQKWVSQNQETLITHEVTFIKVRFFCLAAIKYIHGPASSMHRLQQVFTINENDKVIASIGLLIYPFVHVKEKGLQFHHGIHAYTFSWKRNIYV